MVILAADMCYRDLSVMSLGQTGWHGLPCLYMSALSLSKLVYLFQWYTGVARYDVISHTYHLSDVSFVVQLGRFVKLGQPYFAFISTGCHRNVLGQTILRKSGLKWHLLWSCKRLKEAHNITKFSHLQCNNHFTFDTLPFFGIVATSIFLPKNTSYYMEICYSNNGS